MSASFASVARLPVAEALLIAPFEYIALVWPVLADLLIFRLPIAPAFLLALPLVLAGAALAATEGAARRRPAPRTAGAPHALFRLPAGDFARC